MYCAIFDLDGTLADTSNDLLTAANKQFEQAGFSAPLNAHDRNVALRGGRAMLSLGADRLGLDEAFVDSGYEPLLDFYRDHVSDHTTFYPEALSCIDTLRAQGWATAICTNKPIDLAQKLIAELNAKSYFDMVIGVNSLPERKPDPKPLFHILDRLNATPEKSILIGDTKTDYDAAKNANIDILLVDFEQTHIGDDFPDAPVSRSFVEVKSFLLDWAK